MFTKFMPNFVVKSLLKTSARVKCVPNSMSDTNTLPLLVLLIWYHRNTLGIGNTWPKYSWSCRPRS